MIHVKNNGNKVVSELHCLRSQRSKRSKRSKKDDGDIELVPPVVVPIEEKGEEQEEDDSNLELDAIAEPQDDPEALYEAQRILHKPFTPIEVSSF